jgi:hypothetical protein
MMVAALRLEVWAFCMSTFMLTSWRVVMRTDAVGGATLCCNAYVAIILLLLRFPFFFFFFFFLIFFFFF